MKVMKHSDITPKNLHGRNVWAYLGLAEGIVLRVTTMAPGDVREEDRIPAEHVQLVLSGDIRLTDAQGTVYQLHALDAMSFQAGDARKMENIGQSEATILIVDHGSPHDAWGPNGPEPPKH